MTTPPSPERKKFLRGRHPLFKRLSGDVIWGLYEELGCDDEACGTAMDDFFVEMTAALTIMDSLERNADAHFTLQADPVPCVPCRAVLDTVYTTSDPAWRRFLPPFAVGCRLRCVPLPADHPTPTESTTPAPPTSEPPLCGLLCPLLATPAECCQHAPYTSPHTVA